jgi:hypothetical protein
VKIKLSVWDGRFFGMELSVWDGINGLVRRVYRPTYYHKNLGKKTII